MSKIMKFQLTNGQQLELKLIPPRSQKKEKLTDPSAGHLCFFVANKKLGIYTSIGAENIHHVGNKATKLFGDKWDFVRHERNCEELRGYQHCTVAIFIALLKTI